MSEGLGCYLERRAPQHVTCLLAGRHAAAAAARLLLGPYADYFEQRMQASSHAAATQGHQRQQRGLRPCAGACAAARGGRAQQTTPTSACVHGAAAWLVSGACQDSGGVVGVLGGWVASGHLQLV